MTRYNMPAFCISRACGTCGLRLGRRADGRVEAIRVDAGWWHGRWQPPKHHPLTCLVDRVRWRLEVEARNRAAVEEARAAGPPRELIDDAVERAGAAMESLGRMMTRFGVSAAEAGEAAVALGKAIPEELVEMFAAEAWRRRRTRLWRMFWNAVAVAGVFVGWYVVAWVTISML